MTPQDQTPQKPYSFGRDRYQDADRPHGEPPSGQDASQVDQPNAYPHQGYHYGEHHGVGYGYDPRSLGPHGPGPHSPAPYGPGIPPPPAGHRSLFTVVVLYVVGGFMVLWTGASAAVTIESATAGEGEDLMIGLFMTAGSIAITAGIAAWLIRIHRRRGAYRRILDAHYSRQFGHYLDD